MLPLQPYRPEQPVGAVADYVRSLVPVTGLAVDLFCQGPRFVAEILETGRRALGFNVNPVLLHIARVGLTALDHHALNAGFTHLADSERGDLTLRGYLVYQYRSRCPVCHAIGVAEWFAWRRDVNRPFEKRVRCKKCEGVHTGPVDSDDVALAQSFAARGLSYYYALGRAAAPDHPVRERAAEIVDCYTPRNLSALMALTRGMQDLEAEEAVKAWLVVLLLECFDRCSKLHPYAGERRRPHSLQVPVRYLERNVWHCLEEALSRSDEPLASPTVAEAEDVGELVNGTSTSYKLVGRAARDVHEVLPARSVDLVLVDPPWPDGVFWALCALWASWLWSSPEVQAMRPFLRRRRFDWHWHWRALREAFAAVGPRLTEEGVLTTLFAAPGRAMARSVCLAAADAGYQLKAWGFAPDVGYRLAWVWQGKRLRQPLSAGVSRREMGAEVREAVTSALRWRGEPTTGELLRMAANAQLVGQGLVRDTGELKDDVPPLTFTVEALDQGLEAAPVERIAQGVEPQVELWWLQDPVGAADPLADRVEAKVRELLADRLVWMESELVNTVYACFPGVQLPELELVRTCLESYGIREGSEVHLRSEDDPERRRGETGEVCELLIGLGRRLGFRVHGGAIQNVSWSDGATEAYIFVVSVTAELSSHLLAGRSWSHGAQTYLVVPGGRAKLINLKLRRDPRLERTVRSGQWQFVKFRHVRRLVEEEKLDRSAFQLMLGLDPITEREHQQLRLL